jgi:rhodanese-related sulfurtransferase
MALKNCHFVDARLTKDFQAAHLDGAVNVPIDANDRQRHKLLADIDKNAHIVVYCQSAGCRFAQTVAIKLKDDGYSDVSIFKGGWQQWDAKTGD